MVPGVFKSRSWLSADLNSPGFQKNRHDVVSKCIEMGINWIDACTIQEVKAYSAALKGRRDKMHVGCSWYQKELRNGSCRTKEALLKTLDWGLKDSGIEYADLWRITMHERSSKHSDKEVEEMVKALEQAKKQGKARHIGFSSHDRPHIKKMIEKYDCLEAFCSPFTAKSKKLATDSVFDAIKKCDVGWFGIKPYSSNRLFKGDGTPTGPHAEEDNKLARLALRYIIGNGQITAPIPGMIFTEHVDNAAKAVQELRELTKEEALELEQAMDEAWANLGEEYQWLKDWEYI
jgi:predicted aldo/keto reductase-like oxidoreductase